MDLSIVIVCVCNNISESDLARDPSLVAQCGTQCGTCTEWLMQHPQYLHSVYVTNRDYDNFTELADWAAQCCSSYRGVRVQDVRDILLDCDELAEYFFATSTDAACFMLRWEHSRKSEPTEPQVCCQ